MNYITSLNHTIFPLVLLGIILIVLSLIIDDRDLETVAVKSTSKNLELEKFYEAICQHSELESQLESVDTKADFVDKMMKISSKLGYEFSIAEMKASIANFTSDRYDNYVCISIGCWIFG